MSGHALPGSWTGTLDDLAALANTLLPQYLPLDRSSRTQDEVNPRLIRHYTTQGLLDPPFKEGREARYTRHPALADRHAPFQEHPLALEHFPSGSLILPPLPVRDNR